MKSKSLFIAVFSIGLLGLSCNSTRTLVDDNVYMMRTAAIPVGADLTDETSYSTFKHRKETYNQTDGYYNPNLSVDPRANNNSLFGGWGAPFFATGFYQGNFNPYWGMHRNGFYIGPAYAFMFNPYFYNGYNGMNYGMFNSFGVTYGMNSYFNHMYGNNSMYGQGGFWFNGNNAMYNNGFNGYGNGGFCPSANFGNGGTIAQANYVSSPRSTISGGYYSGNDRGGNIQVKSPQNSSYTVENTNKRVYDNSAANNTNVSRERSAPTYTRQGVQNSREIQTREYSDRRNYENVRTTTYPSGRNESIRNTSTGNSGFSRESSGGSRESIGGSNGSSGRSGGSSGARPGGRGN